jgi:hypothetical protein
MKNKPVVLSLKMPKGASCKFVIYPTYSHCWIAGRLLSMALGDRMLSERAWAWTAVYDTKPLSFIIGVHPSALEMDTTAHEVAHVAFRYLAEYVPRSKSINDASEMVATVTGNLMQDLFSQLLRRVGARPA